jgi:hypothetical protein
MPRCRLGAATPYERHTAGSGVSGASGPLPLACKPVASTTKITHSGQPGKALSARADVFAATIVAGTLVRREQSASNYSLGRKEAGADGSDSSGLSLQSGLPFSNGCAGQASIPGCPGLALAQIRAGLITSGSVTCGNTLNSNLLASSLREGDPALAGPGWFIQ